MSDQVMAADGRVIGARAYKTRRRLLEATAKLLEERGALGLRVVDVTREVGTSPATFYQYFPDVEEAILALAEEATEDVASVRQFLEVPWNGAKGVQQARGLVEAFMEYRDRHRAILRVRDLKAEEGDLRFRAVRQRGYAALMADLVAKVEEGQAAGRVSTHLNPYATAAASLAMMERLLAYQTEFGRRGVGKDAMAETISVLLYQTVTGRKG